MRKTVSFLPEKAVVWGLHCAGPYVILIFAVNIEHAYVHEVPVPAVSAGRLFYDGAEEKTKKGEKS